MTSVQLKQLLSLGPGACWNTSDVLQHRDSSLGFLLLGQDAQPRWSRTYLEAYVVSTIRWQPKKIFHGALLQIVLPTCQVIIDKTNLVTPKTASGLSFEIKDCVLSSLMQALVSFFLRHSVEAGPLCKQTVTGWATLLSSLKVLMALELRWGKKYYQGGVIFNNSLFAGPKETQWYVTESLCRISVGLRPAGWIFFWLAKFR